MSVTCACFSACCSSLAALLIFLFPHPFENLNNKIYDWKLRISPSQNYSPDIVHADIDNQAVKEYGQWPWDRSLSAKIVEKLSEFGAAVIAFDIFYSSEGKSKQGNEAFFEAIRRAGNVISATGLGTLTDRDEQLKLPQDRSQADALYDTGWPLPVPEHFHLLRVSELRDDSAVPLLPIIQNSKGIGHITGNPDRDGVYRRVALLVRLADHCIPSFSLATLMAYWNLSPDHIVLNGKKEIQIKRGSDLITIPVDTRGMLLVHWGDPWTSFKHYSVKDVLNDAPDPARAGRYKGKIVIIGITATGNRDFGATPLSLNAPLSRIHSHSLNTILTGNFILQISPFPWIIVSSILLAILFPLTTSRLSLTLETLSAGLISLAAFVGATVCLFLWSYDIPLIEAFFVFLPAACGSLLIRGASIEWEAALAKRALERYMPPELLRESFRSGMNPDLSTRRQELTVVFVDMQRFSTLSESVEVEYISRFLKDFFERMTRAILKHQGRIHQFLGDGFLAVFGDLAPLPNHAEAAFAAALEMQKEMAALNSEWAPSGIAEFANGLSIRIGINTGMVFVGDLGSDQRLEYTIVGSAVNIASRLQSLAPPGGILLAARTRALLENPNICRGPENVKLKGFERYMEVYTVYPDSIQSSEDSPAARGPA